MQDLTSKELGMIAALLQLASDEFVNHGCNDFDLREYGLTPEDIVLTRSVGVER